MEKVNSCIQQYFGKRQKTCHAPGYDQQQFLSHFNYFIPFLFISKYPNFSNLYLTNGFEIEKLNSSDLFNIKPLIQKELEIIKSIMIHIMLNAKKKMMYLQVHIILNIYQVKI